MMIWAFPYRVGLSVLIFCFLKEKTKGFPLQSLTQKQHKMETTNKITKDDFMTFFRDDESLNLLSIDDRIEIFQTILVGSSDFTKDLLDEFLSDYCVSNLEIIEIENGKK
jgi:hypothetical protein